MRKIFPFAQVFIGSERLDLCRGGEALITYAAVYCKVELDHGEALAHTYPCTTIDRSSIKTSVA